MLKHDRTRRGLFFSFKIRCFTLASFTLLAGAEVPKGHMETSPQPKLGSAKSSSVVVPFLLTLACGKRLGYPRDLSMRFAVWDILKKIQENEIDPREFRETLVKLYEQDVYKNPMLLPPSGYLPELVDNEEDYIDPVKIKELDNPILESWDYILRLMDKKYGSDDRSLYNLTLWSDRIDKVADNMQDWLIAKGISPSSDILHPSFCDNLKKRPWQGEVYENYIKDLKKTVQLPAPSASYVQRNPEALHTRPYVPPEIVLPLEADPMAEVFLKALWCENISDVYHELVHRLQERNFTLEEFLEAVERKSRMPDKYNLRKGDKVGTYTVRRTYGDMYASDSIDFRADRKDFDANDAGLFDILDPLEKIYRYTPNVNIDSKERFFRTVDNADLIKKLEHRLQLWQRNHMLELDSKDKFYKRECVAAPSRIAGQEFRNYLASAMRAKKTSKAFSLTRTGSEPSIHASLAPHGKMEELEYAAMGSAYAMGRAQRFFRTISCSRIMGYKNEVSTHSAIWEMIEEIQAKKLNPEEFIERVKYLYDSEFKSKPSYLPRLFESSKKPRTREELRLLVEGKNPVMPALEYILELAKEPVRHAQDISYAITLVDMWAREKGIQDHKLSLAQCTRAYEKTPLKGNAYKASLLIEKKNQRFPVPTHDFSVRNPNMKINIPYKAPHNFSAISAKEAARRWVEGLWCENIVDLYWETAYRLSHGHFTFEEFKQEVGEAHMRLEHLEDYKLESRTSVTDILEGLKYFYINSGNSIERWTHFSNDKVHFLGPEVKLVQWQKARLLRKNGKQKSCREKPSGQVGQELRVYMGHAYTNWEDSMIDAYALGATLDKKRLGEVNKDSNDKLLASIQSANDAIKTEETKHAQDLKAIAAKYTALKTAQYNKYLADLAREKAEKVRVHKEQLFDLIHMNGLDYVSRYRADGFAGACTTVGDKTWSNNKVLSAMYRRFAESYSDEVRARAPDLAKERARLEKSVSDPVKREAQLKAFTDKLLRTKRNAMLEEFKMLFYVACAESDFNPLYSMAFIRNEEGKYSFEREMEYSLAGALRYKKKLLARAEEGKKRSSVIYSQGNHGPFQSSIDRFYIGENAGGFIEQQILGALIVKDKVVVNGKETLVPNKEKSLPLINKFCQTERTFTPAEVGGVNEEVYNTLVKTSEDDLFELASVRDVKLYKDRDEISAHSIAAYGVLHGICLPFSIQLHQMTMKDFKGGSYYETLMAKDTKMTCSDSGAKTLCSAPLKDLASKVEALAMEEGLKTSVYDDLTQAKDLELGKAYQKQRDLYESTQRQDEEARTSMRDQEIKFLSGTIDLLEESRQRANEKYQRDLKARDELRDQEIKKARELNLGLDPNALK